jgi:hypothetical protein
MKRFDYVDDTDDDRLFEPRKKGGSKLKKMRDGEKARESKKERDYFKKRK